MPKHEAIKPLFFIFILMVDVYGFQSTIDNRSNEDPRSKSGVFSFCQSRFNFSHDSVSVTKCFFGMECIHYLVPKSEATALRIQNIGSSGTELSWVLLLAKDSNNASGAAEEDD